MSETSETTGPQELRDVELSAGGGPARGGPAGRRGWLVAMAATSVLCTAAGLVAAQFIRSPAQVAAETAPPEADVLTAAVEYRVLKESVVLRGTVRAGQTIDVAPRGAGEGTGEPVITRLPVEAGDRVEAGKVVLEVSGRPVFALPGNTPMYRDLKPGAEGRDVAQLQAALRGLGHGTGTDARDVFGAGTKAALTEFYASIGYEPRQAEADGGERLRKAREAVRAAERALQDAGRAGAGGPAGREQGTDPGVARRRAGEDLVTAKDELADAEAESGPMLPADEVVFVQGLPALVGSVTGSVGTRVSGTVLQLSAGEPVVQGHLQEYQRHLVRVGQKVRILSELTGKETAAEVASVADVPETGKQGEGEGAAPGDGPVAGSYRLVVEPVGGLGAGSAGQDVRLTVESASTQGKALVVPLTAVSAGADSRTSVTVLETDGTRRRVEVRTGTQGDGFVEVVPAGGRTGLERGDRVVIGLRGSGATGTGSSDPGGTR